MIQCKHWSDCGIKGAGKCALGLFGGRPSEGVCKQCPSYEGPSRGLGDDVDKVLKTVTLGVSAKVKKKCGGCKKRQAKLNNKFPRKGKND